MLKILLYIIFFVVIYKIIQISIRVFSTARSFKQSFYRHQEQEFNSGREKSREGDTYITYVPEEEKKGEAKGKDKTQGDGEYIDYEEVK